jgi:hypothetical protein
MRTIEPTLTEELTRHVGDAPVWRADPYAVKTYRELVEHIARLSYANPNQLLFFRGQDKDYQSKAGGTTLYPAIYRGDQVPRRELQYRFEQLDIVSRVLVARFAAQEIVGYRDVARKKLIQWSILQHYQVVDTPLLDVTHSVRVACSFAQYGSSDPTCYVYVIGLPYTANRISINSEEDIVNIRLLNICPPSAIRPYFQEGYMAGTPDVTYEFESKTELDFRNRLIAKFAIPRARSSFWRGGFDVIPRKALYPPNDKMEEICAEIRASSEEAQQPAGDLGEFILEWAHLEEALLDRARRITERNVSVGEAINALSRAKLLSPNTARELHELRQFRNRAVHAPHRAATTAIDFAGAIQRILAVANAIA